MGKMVHIYFTRDLENRELSFRFDTAPVPFTFHVDGAEYVVDAPNTFRLWYHVDGPDGNRLPLSLNKATVDVISNSDVKRKFREVV